MPFSQSALDLFVVVFLGIFLSQITCDLPGDDMPDLVPSSCSTDADCKNYLYARCNGGTCTGCNADSQCTRWDPSAHCYASKCYIPCTSASQDICRLQRMRCSTSENRCQGCSVDGDCVGYPGSIYCQFYGPILGICVNCRNDGDCSAGFTCQNYKCTECSSDTDCLTPTPYCIKKYEQNACKECKQNSDCTDPTKSFCSSGTCVACSSHPQCSHLSPNTYCYSGTCINAECTTVGECTNVLKSYCNLSTQVCQSCFNDNHCSHLPNVNKCWYGECVIYSPVCIPTYTVSIVQEKSLNDFVINFDPRLVTKIDILASIKIQLLDIDPTYYSFTIVKVTNTQFKINFQVQKTIPQTRIHVEVPCPTQPGYVYGNIIKEINTKKIPYGSADLKAALQTLGSAATAATTAVGGISGAMMFMGANPMILWGLIGSIQAFYYMLFINVQYPVNVQAFFPIFSLGNLDFIPNPTWVIFPDIDDFSLPVPEKFEEQQVDGLFLANAGNMVFLWLGNMALYGFSYLIMRYTRNQPKLLAIGCSKVVETFEWSGTFRVFITSYMELTIAAFLQLRVLDFTSGLFSASSICGIIFGTFGILLPVLTYKIVQKYDSNPKYIKFKFGTLIENFKLTDDFHKYFTVISIGRSLILAASLVYLHNYPYIEIFTLTTLSFSFAFLLFKYKPYSNRVSNISNFISELVFGVVHVFIFILIHDDYSLSFSDEQRMNLGWGIICGCGVILMASIALAITEQVSVVIKMVGLLKKLLKKENKTREKRIKKLTAKIQTANRESTQIAVNESMAKLNQSLDLSLSSQLVKLPEMNFTMMMIKRPVKINKTMAKTGHE